MNKKIVDIVHVREDIAQPLKESLRNYSLNKKQKIFIKPNICAPKYTPGVVTNPQLIYELVSLLRNHAKEVVVGESDGYNYPCKLALEETGIKATIEKAGGTVVNLSKDIKVEVKIQNSQIKKLVLPKSIINADSIIDVPVMKTHEYKIFTGAVKNLFGCIPDERRIYLHPHLCEVLLGLYSFLKPDLTVMDAIVAMEGNGPTAGEPVKMDLLLTGNDAMAVDVIATKLMKLNWNNIDYLKYIAQKTKFDEKNIILKGDKIVNHSRKFKLPRKDLPVEAQLLIYKNTLMTKIFFRSLKIVKMLQKITCSYRKIKEKKQDNS